MQNNYLLKLQRLLKIDLFYAFSGGIWLSSAHVINIFAVLVSSYAFANYLPPEIYGQYKYILTIGLTLTALSFTGAGGAIAQAAAKGVTGFFTHMRKINFLYSLIISALAMIFSLYYYIQDNSTLAFGLIIIALLQPLFNNSFLIFSYLNGTQQFKISSVGQIFRTIFVTAVMVCSVLLTNNVFILLIAYFISNTSINYLLHLKYAPPHDSASNAIAVQKIVNFGKHSSLQNIISGVSNQFDKILIFQNLGAIDLAVYTFATALPDQMKTLTSTVETLLLPRYNGRDAVSIKKGIVHKSIIYFTVLLSGVTLYICLAPSIFSFVYPQYSDAVFFSQLYALGILSGISGLPLTALKSQMSKVKLYKFNISTSIFQILSLIILLPLFGLIGAILSKIVYRFVVCVSAYVLYYQK